LPYRYYRVYFKWPQHQRTVRDIPLKNIKMFEKLEHLGIAVKNIEASNPLFASLLGQKSPYKVEEVASEGVKTAFYDGGNVKIELLEATKTDSPIHKFIEKRGEGLHHIAFEVENIEKSMEEMRQKGIRLLNETPKQGADNKLICFLHPKDTNGILIELCQDKDKIIVADEEE